MGLTRRGNPEDEKRTAARTANTVQPSQEKDELLTIYTEQINLYYSLPDKPRKKVSEIPVFSPSEAAMCPRELFFIYSPDYEPNEPQPQKPIRKRIPDVGTALHLIRQERLKKMAAELERRGFPVRVRVKTMENGKPAIEVDFEKTVTHRDETFTIKGRLDAILEITDHNGEVHTVIWDLKAKTLKSKLRKIDQEVDKYKYQMACYRILTDIRKAILEFESTQKDWSRDGATDDVVPVLIDLTDDLVAQVLDKYAYVTACLRNGIVPEMEPNAYYCANLCKYSDACRFVNEEGLA